ncbi:MAG: DUF2249 domain-containing protein [Magnetococcales bacterium]|nr:DUF2249 domain-containing protein [Magnetococcales bacterium]
MDPRPLITPELSLDRLREDYPQAWAVWTRGCPALFPPQAAAEASLRQVAPANLPLLLYRMHQAEGLLADYLPTLPVEERIRLTRLCAEPDATSDAADPLPPERIHALDVRPILQQGVDPFAAIQEALDQLPRGDGLALTAPFEPIPLHAALARRGFTHRARRQADGTWRVLYHPAPREPGAAVAPPSPAAEALDLRGLPPPEPLLRALQAVVALPPGGVLTTLHDRPPHLLLPRLAERGLEVAQDEDPEGSVRLTIRRPP